MSASDSFDVAIVGLGPVGGTAALQLAHAGFRVVVIDRSTEAAQLPRAVMLDGETLRSFQGIGLGDEVSAIVQPPREPNNLCFTNSKREVLFGIDVPPLGPMGWCDVNFFDQPEFETLLRGLIAKDARIEVRLGHEVTAIEQDADSVRLETRELASPNGGGSHVSAEWLIGCDGASSFVREQMGIPWKSLGYDQDWLVVDVREKPGSNLPLVTMQVCDPARLTTYVCVKNPRRRWEFQLQPGETREQMVRPEKVEELLAPWASPDEYELERAAVYQFHAATADRWREGRVFLAGDAAHQTPPFLGQGLNAGLRDAVNLAWKLAWVRDGRSDERFLDRYFEERDPHARKLVEGAVAIGKLMEFLAAREAGVELPQPEHAFGPDGPANPTLTTGLLIEEQTGLDGPAGAMFAQPTLRAREGEERRIDDILGAGFAVVTRKGANASVSARTAAQLERLAIPIVSLDDYECTAGSVDRRLDEHAALIVRPDRYIFGVTDEHRSLDDLVEALVDKLALRDEWIVH